MPESDQLDTTDPFSEVVNPVTVSFSTNVDLKRDTMTDAMWINLGKFVADVAENTRNSRPVVRITGDPVDV